MPAAVSATKQYSSDEYGQDEVKKFSQSEIYAYTSILESAIQNLQILGALCAAPIALVDLEYKTVGQKYGANGYQAHAAPTTEASSPGLKFQKDRGYAEQILTELKLEIASSGETTKFLRRLDQHSRSESERQGLLDEAMSNRERLQELRNLLETPKLKEELHEKSQQIQKIACAYEDMVYENEIKESYQNSWEASRIYQNNFLINQRETKLQNAINFTLEDTQNETRVHLEVEFFETELQNDCTNLIETWMGNYERDLEDSETALQMLKQKRDDQLKVFEELENEYNQREEDMRNYMEEREIRLEAEVKLRKMTVAAVKIQVWWRWLMRRLHLGPYRKKRKTKKGKKKK